MPSPFASLPQRFFPTRYRLSAKGAECLRSAGPRQEWLLPRASCIYTVIDCRTVPVAKRKVFVDTSIRRIVPFADPDYQLAWHESWAMVWAWSKAAAAELASGLPPADGAPTCYPESLFLSGRTSEGVQLLRLSEGFEGRSWRDSVLRLSAWWPTAPSLEAWNEFLRQAGLPASEDVPAATIPTWEVRPWSRLRSSDWRDSLSNYRRELVAVAAGLVLAAYCHELGALWRMDRERAALVAEMQNQDAGLQRILEAREAAERDAQLVRELLSLRGPVGPLTMLARFKQAMPEQGWHLKQWQLNGQDRMEVLLQAEGLDPETVVRVLEQSGHFSEVSVNLTGGARELAVKARIKPHADGGPA